MYAQMEKAKEKKNKQSTFVTVNRAEKSQALKANALQGHYNPIGQRRPIGTENSNTAMLNQWHTSQTNEFTKTHQREAINEKTKEPAAQKAQTITRMGYTKASGYGIHGQYHTFIIAVNPVTKDQYITRAGPTMSVMGLTSSGLGGSASAAYGSGGEQLISGSGFGAIKAQHDDWTESLKYDQPSQTVYMQNIGTVNMPYANVVSNMAAFSDSINARSIGYWPTGPNSNSYAFSYIEQLGFSRPTPALGAPGWKKKL